MKRAVMALVVLAACGAPSAGEPALCDPVMPGDAWINPSGWVLTVVATSPSPPARFTNWWTVSIDAPDGTPMTDPELVEVSAFMPAHGHATPITPDVEPEPAGLRVGPLELWMPGTWEVRFDIPAERIVVSVCIAE